MSCVRHSFVNYLCFLFFLFHSINYFFLFVNCKGTFNPIDFFFQTENVVFTFSYFRLWIFIWNYKKSARALKTPAVFSIKWFWLFFATIWFDNKIQSWATMKICFIIQLCWSRARYVEKIVNPKPVWSRICEMTIKA